MKNVLVTSWIPAFRSSPLLVLFLVATLPSVLQAEKEIRIPAGQSADAWWGVNVSGKLGDTIRTRDGSNKVKFWWIKWGFGTLEEVGGRADSGTIVYRFPSSRESSRRNCERLLMSIRSYTFERIPLPMQGSRFAGEYCAWGPPGHSKPIMKLSVKVIRVLLSACPAARPRFHRE